MGVLQELSQVRERLDRLSDQTDERFKLADEQDIQTLQRVCAIEEVMGITRSGAGLNEENVRLRCLAESPLAGTYEELMRRVVGVQSGMEELRQQIYELRREVIRATPAEFVAAPRGIDDLFGTVPLRQEIPKRQNPPLSVKRAAKMAAAKPAAKRRR